MEENIPKPKYRSRLRLFLGRNYFTFKRKCKWIFDKKTYAKEKGNQVLFYAQFGHRTPLLRKLKDVDMQLQYNKIINLKLAIKKLNNIIIKPGETFSYWKLIGKPTKRKGYVDGIELSNGKYKRGIGGGLCQLSNLIYWMALHTPLSVTERHRHGYDVFPDEKRTQPFGSGATCYYNYVDLQITNETNKEYQFCFFLNDEHLVGEIRGKEPKEFEYEVYEKEHRIDREIWGGYTRHNLIFRKKRDIQGNLLEDEFLVENHAIMMYQPFLGDISQSAAM